ncbi:MAG: polymer-forming cytoskeletal protein [Acidobacteria bacterium]|nr:polymer-forming cytoskeletal protein [Acidobacteriota bacterium]MCI0568441.1 polymer-forming cytoskeletal protein [Acidobacteriota bacterium]
MLKKNAPHPDSKQDSHRQEVEIAAATVIGPELVLCGELVSEENIRVRGRMEGNISTSGSLVVEPSGYVKGDITAENVVVEGIVEGTVIAALKFELRPAGRMQGDIRASVVSIAEDSFLRGRVLATERVSTQMKRRVERR